MELKRLEGKGGSPRNYAPPTPPPPLPPTNIKVSSLPCTFSDSVAVRVCWDGGLRFQTPCVGWGGVGTVSMVLSKLSPTHPLLVKVLDTISSRNLPREPHWGRLTHRIPVNGEVRCRSLWHHLCFTPTSRTMCASRPSLRSTAADTYRTQVVQCEANGVTPVCPL